MCGIFCLVSSTQEESTLLEKFKLFSKPILRRGPNSMNSHCYKSVNCSVLFVSSVLWLQGNDITVQPLKNENSIFIYNGDNFGGFASEELRNDIGDTKLFLETLEGADNISQTLHNVQGPYAFVYLNIAENKIYFGRDVYGRRSLLIGKSGEQLIITSVAKRDTQFEFMELPSIGTFSMNLKTKNWQIFPWKRKNKNFNDKLQEIELFLERNIVTEGAEYEEIKTFVPPDQSQLTLFKEIISHKKDNIFDTLCNSHWLEKIMNLKKLLENAVKKRISTQTNFCQNCFKRHDCNHSITGVLFSGGVDCAILALLASKFADESRSIDLINVAFDRAKDYKTPDRLTGIETLKELQNLCPQRKWNFVEVNVPKRELDLFRSKDIADLIYPLDSVLDDSLGCALWFASRATSNSYTSPCRVLLVGMGADELFGGYTRHRSALQKRSWQGLHETLDEDWQNLSHRNLGRDDRVISDHGRQLRTPYLDEEVVRFVKNLDTWEKTFPSNDLPQGIGEKILLRSLAYHLGLKNAAILRKRALQFGSRIAIPKENAHDISVRLTL